MTHPADHPTQQQPNKRPKTAAKASIMPLFLAALVGGSVTFLLMQLQFSVWIEPAGIDPAPPVIDTAPAPTASTSAPQASPTASTQPAQTAAPSLPTAVRDGLQVKNQSTYALRVVLLSRQSGQDTKRNRQSVHWDFAPGEGAQVGLLLSLPGQKLTLARGDVLVAFALDGSRRYWGPYVVGETTAPARIDQEWQLVLRP